MKAPEIRRLSLEHDRATLDAADLLGRCGYYLTALEAACGFLAPGKP